MNKLYSLAIFSVISVGWSEGKAFSSFDTHCGRITSNRKGRIVGGNPAGEKQFPWIVSIKNGKTHLCGGSIISSRFILTAAHCFEFNLKNGTVVETRAHPDLKSWTVTVGTVTKNKEESQSNFKIKKFIFYSDSDLNTNDLMHDIVMLELSEEIEWSDRIRPICLPSKDVVEYKTAVAPGWGNDFNMTQTENVKLRFVELSIFQNAHCNKIYTERNLGVHLAFTQMCAGSLRDIQDTTEGDSGGPLQIKFGGRAILVGITSASIRESIQTPPKPPGIYTRVYKYLDWIHLNIRNRN